MAYRLEPTGRLEDEVKRVASERLDDALARLDAVQGGDDVDFEESVHEVRKRCKESRALARLIRANLTKTQYSSFNRRVRDAARELAGFRDTHAVLRTVDKLEARGTNGGPDFDAVRAGQQATPTCPSALNGETRIERASRLLTKARRQVDDWVLPEGFEAFEAGVTRSYEAGREGLVVVRQRPNDERVHEWRKAVKDLWYQVRLLERSAPSALGPLEAGLDDLAELLGDDHDLAVLIGRLRADPARHGGRKATKRAVRLARAAQNDLRARSFRLGATLYAETTPVLVDRMRVYWENAVELGPERSGRQPDRAMSAPAPPTVEPTVERERKFLLAAVPRDSGPGIELRQGYLAIDGSVSVRIREAGPGRATLTVKAGSGAVRTELEFPITDAQFDAAWDLTEGRRLRKTRFRIPVGDQEAEVDVFADELDGLQLVEVEFDSDAAMDEFVAPSWFGPEVTEDLRYTNAFLSVRGRP